MPNQLNYPDQIPFPYVGDRPERLAALDRNLVDSGSYQVLFGTTAKDVVEVFVYDINGSISGHVNIIPTDTELSLTTVLDNTGAYELLNIDMTQAVQNMFIEPGYYGLTVNYFRNEVGSEPGNKLVIEAISQDRTELRLYPMQVEEDTTQELFDFIDPTVPKLFAQGLLNETFGVNTEVQSEAPLSPELVLTQLDAIDSDTSDRLTYANAMSSYDEMTTAILKEAYLRTLDNMASDTSVLNVHEINLESYLTEAITNIIHELETSGLIDSRFEVS